MPLHEKTSRVFLIFLKIAIKEDMGMTKKRVVETNEGIQDELTIEVFDAFAQTMRDKGWGQCRHHRSFRHSNGQCAGNRPGSRICGTGMVKKMPRSDADGL